MLIFPTLTYLQYFDVMVQIWEASTPSSRLNSLNIFTQPWYSKEGMNNLWRQYRACQDFGIFSGRPLPDTYLRDTALIVINGSGQYRQTYLDFKREAIQTYANVKIFFNAREADLDDVHIKAGGYEYGMYTFEGDALDDAVAELPLG